jgi:hypothetical protein
MIHGKDNESGSRIIKEMSQGSVTKKSRIHYRETEF